MLLLMTTPMLISMLQRLVMVLVTLLDLTLLLSLMVVPSMLTTRLMDMKDMLLMLPMKELLPTQLLLHQPTMLHQLFMLLQSLMVRSVVSYAGKDVQTFMMTKDKTIDKITNSLDVGNSRDKRQKTQQYLCLFITESSE